MTRSAEHDPYGNYAPTPITPASLAIEAREHMKALKAIDPHDDDVPPSSYAGAVLDMASFGDSQDISVARKAFIAATGQVMEHGVLYNQEHIYLDRQFELAGELKGAYLEELYATWRHIPFEEEFDQVEALVKMAWTGGDVRALAHARSAIDAYGDVNPETNPDEYKDILCERADLHKLLARLPDQYQSIAHVTAYANSLKPLQGASYLLGNRDPLTRTEVPMAVDPSYFLAADRMLNEFKHGMFEEASLVKKVDYLNSTIRLWELTDDVDAKEQYRQRFMFYITELPPTKTKASLLERGAALDPTIPRQLRHVHIEMPQEGRPFTDDEKALQLATAYARRAEFGTAEQYAHKIQNLSDRTAAYKNIIIAGAEDSFDGLCRLIDEQDPLADNAFAGMAAGLLQRGRVENALRILRYMPNPASKINVLRNATRVLNGQLPLPTRYYDD